MSSINRFILVRDDDQNFYTPLHGTNTHGAEASIFATIDQAFILKILGFSWGVAHDPIQHTPFLTIL